MMAESTSSQPKAKKARISSSSSSASSSKPESILKVTSLQSQLSNSTDLNPLNDLIQFSIQLTRQTYSESHSQSQSFESDCKALHKAINVLSRALITLTQSDKIPLNTSDNEGLATGGNKIKKGENEGMVKVRVWLRNRWNESVLLLCALLAHQREEIKVSHYYCGSCLMWNRRLKPRTARRREPIPKGTNFFSSQTSAVFCRSPPALLSKSLQNSDLILIPTFIFLSSS